jgi:flagellar biosynthesis protein FlhF
MQLKSFYGPNIRIAMSRAEAEWGPNAMLVNSQPATPDSGHAGDIEVVCALATPAAVSPQDSAERGAPAKTVRESTSDSEIAGIREQVDGIRRALSRLSLPGPAWLPRSSALARYFSKLIDVDMDQDLALDVIEKVFYRLAAAGDGMGSYDETSVRDAVVSELKGRLSPGTTMTDSRTDAIALVGPPGVGKTTTLVKLAITEGLQRHRATQIICLDTYRVAAADQLRSYSAILGIPCQVVDDPNLVRQTVETNRGRDLVLIDTPGVGAAEADILEDFGRSLQDLGSLQVHLVLPSCQRTSDLQKTAARFASVRPTHLLFTRTDETACFGPLYSLAVIANRPISYLCGGQQVPEDIEVARAESICDFLTPNQVEVRSAACA